MKCIEEGDVCGAFCGGHLVASTPEHCACHIVAPCGACENAGFECSECGRKDDDPAPVPEIETLARAIFETDSSVISFVREKSETIESDRTPHGIPALPIERIDGKWVHGDTDSEAEAVITYAIEPGPETGHVGWCWWALGKMGDAETLRDAMTAAERAIQERIDK